MTLPFVQRSATGVMTPEGIYLPFGTLTEGEYLKYSGSQVISHQPFPLSLANGGWGGSQAPESVSIAEGGTLTGSTHYWRVTATNPVTCSATTPLAAGTVDGEFRYLENVGKCEFALPCGAASNLRDASYSQRVLYPNNAAILRWNATASKWRIMQWDSPQYFDFIAELAVLAAGGTHNFLTTSQLGPWNYVLTSGSAPSTLTASSSGIAFACGAVVTETQLVRTLLLDIPLSQVNAVNWRGQINATGSSYGGDSYFQVTLRDLAATQEVGASFLVGNGSGFQYGNVTYSSDATEVIAGVNDNWVSAARAVNWRSRHMHGSHALWTDAASANAVVPIDIDASTTQANWPVEAGSTVAVRIRFINTATGATQTAKSYAIPQLALSLG